MRDHVALFDGNRHPGRRRPSPVSRGNVMTTASNAKTIITCAITGNLTRPDQHPGLPITPEQIARSSLDAAEEGASIVHIHVRDLNTGRPSMDVSLYREAMERIRERNSELIINLT